MLTITLAEWANANGVHVSKNGYKCDNDECDSSGLDDTTEISSDPTFYMNESGSGYSWYEVCKCSKCGNMYAVENGN